MKSKSPPGLVDGVMPVEVQAAYSRYLAAAAKVRAKGLDNADEARELGTLKASIFASVKFHAHAATNRVLHDAHVVALRGLSMRKEKGVSTNQT